MPSIHQFVSPQTVCLFYPCNTPSAASRPESRLESALAAKILLDLRYQPASKAALAAPLGHKNVPGELHKQIKRLRSLGLIEFTMPEKLNSRLQNTG
ncbi:MAG: hypothetical protein HS122_13100 [Opitutaceae bacterium]|nr:hypothetical protein [Opitutaceae bacterium]